MAAMSSKKQSTCDADQRVGPGIVQPYQRQGPVNLARRLSQVFLSAVAEVLPPDALRNEMGTLVAIANVPGLEQKKIATVLAIDATSVGQVIDHLEMKGFVRRTVSSADRRVKFVTATAEGLRRIAEYRPKILKAQAEVLSVLSAEERKTLVDLMARVIEANPQHDRPGAGRRPPKPKGD
jgi:DNA-binding MarR family transcriptional regulator